ncbi:MAG TPA: PGPGW domain-containing protein [Candidatus Saccharimonadales bacterium]|nr:PGPGW domain-containing protein [Candidatus Saccharimonadales bacterium]
MKAIIKLLKKMAVFIVGAAFLLAGIIMLVTPGPGLVGIITGLVILSIEFEWAEKYLKIARKKLKETNDKIKEKTSR